ncbi:MAG: nucleotidyltransferase domain-containing protein [bacterium]
MPELKIIKEVTEDLIREIVDCIVKAVDPDKIILFGSFARGETHKHSDLDILVVKESDLPSYERSIPVYHALRHLVFPMDVFVYTPDEINEWRNVPQAFITSIVKAGKVIYERQERSCQGMASQSGK